MKAFACLAVLFVFAGVSNAFNLGEIIAKGRADAEELREKTEALIKQGQEQVSGFFKQLEDMKNICKKINNETINCCADDPAKNHICVDFQVETSTLSVIISMVVNNQTLLRHKISGENPPPICTPLPQIPIFAICMKPYQLKFENGTASACLAMGAKVIGHEFASVDLKCIELDKQGKVHFLPPQPKAAKAAQPNQMFQWGEAAAKLAMSQMFKKN